MYPAPFIQKNQHRSSFSYDSRCQPDGCPLSGFSPFQCASDGSVAHCVFLSVSPCEWLFLALLPASLPVVLPCLASGFLAGGASLPAVPPCTWFFLEPWVYDLSIKGRRTLQLLTVGQCKTARRAGYIFANVACDNGAPLTPDRAVGPVFAGPARWGL